MAHKRVVTERDVRRAIEERATVLDVTGLAVTPSAIDRAHRAGLILRGLRGEDGRVRTKGKPSAAGPARGQSAESRATAASSALVAPSAPPSDATLGPSSSRRSALRVGIGADHGGVALKDTIAKHLRELGHSVVDHGTTGTDPVDYPDFALAIAREVAAGAAQFGIMVDGAGIGSCMVANKVRGVRAAMCYDVTTAGNAREHNNANVLTLGGGLIGARLGLEIVEKFLSTEFAGGRHARRVEKIDALDVGR